MILYFTLLSVICFFGSMLCCLISDLIKSKKQTNPKEELFQKYFVNSPEENQRLIEIDRRRSFFQSLLSNVALVLLVLLLYWLCL